MDNNNMKNLSHAVSESDAIFLYTHCRIKPSLVMWYMAATILLTVLEYNIFYTTHLCTLYVPLCVYTFGFGAVHFATGRAIRRIAKECNVSELEVRQEAEKIYGK